MIRVGRLFSNKSGNLSTKYRSDRNDIYYDVDTEPEWTSHNWKPDETITTLYNQY